MKRIFRLGAFTGLMMAFFGIQAAETANAADLYTIKGVHVDVTAASASEARTIAQARGQKDALNDLMRRLTLVADWSRLPDVPDNVVQDAVRGFQVASEKASSTRYIADLNVSFRPDALRNLLKRNNILFGETQAKAALLVPIYRKGDTEAFWDDSNPWRDAVAARDLDNAMTPLLLPLGDVQEFGLLTSMQAVNGDQQAIKNLGQRYGADDVIVAIATVNGAGTSVSLTINRYGPNGGEPLKRSYQSLDEAAAGLIAVLGEQWKRDTIVEPGTQAQLTAAVFFSSLDQWEAIRKGLASTPLVNGLQVEGITATGAEVQVSYRGSPEKLALSLAQANVVLAKSADESWTLQAR